MKIEYLHASKYGNGAMVAEEFSRQMAAKGVTVEGTKYAILTTEAAPHPDRAGHVPSEQELARWTRVRPIMNEILQRKGLVEVAEAKIQVTDIKGPLEEGWQHKVEAFTARIPVQG